MRSFTPVTGHRPDDLAHRLEGRAPSPKNPGLATAVPGSCKPQLVVGHVTCRNRAPPSGTGTTVSSRTSGVTVRGDDLGRSPPAACYHLSASPTLPGLEVSRRLNLQTRDRPLPSRRPWTGLSPLPQVTVVAGGSTPVPRSPWFPGQAGEAAAFRRPGRQPPHESASASGQ